MVMVDDAGVECDRVAFRKGESGWVRVRARAR